MSRLFRSVFTSLSVRPVLAALVLVTLLIAAGLPVQAQDDNAGAAEVGTHYALSRPIPLKNNPRAALGFPFGSDRRGRSPLHHGVDMVNPRGTPILAAADGTVLYAGPDTDRVFGPKANFYGNVVVIAHDFDAPEGGKVYTLYGHMYRIDVQAEQRVAAGERIGSVGATGIALGSHLHFEVRIGNPDDYFAVRNPELWYPPLANTGTLIGRIVNADGAHVLGVAFSLVGEQATYPGYSYLDPALPSDPAYNENFTMADLPAGCYRLRIRGGAGYLYNERLCIKAGQTLFLEVKLAG